MCLRSALLSLASSVLLFAGVLSAETTKIRVQVLESGEVRAWEEENAGKTFDESLVNLGYSTGAMMVHLEPLLTMFGVVLVSEDGTSPLDVAATEELLANPPENIKHSVRAVTPLVHRVDSDGTFEQPLTGRIPIQAMRAWFSRLDVPRRARELLAETDGVNIRYLEQWLRGAKDWSRAHEARLYTDYPALRETNVIAAFQTKTVQHLMEHLIIQGMLYDFFAITSVTGVTNWIDQTPLTSAARSRSSNSPRHHSVPEPFQHFTLGKPIGASNGAAFTYRPEEAPTGRRCVTIGEPHQPSLEEDSPQSRAKIFQLFTRDSEGKILPILFMSPAGHPTPALSFSPHHRLSGTAGPSLGALNFFAPLQGLNYQSEDGAWRQLEQETKHYEWTGELRSFTVYSVPGFGEVFARLKDPTSGLEYVALRRPKSERSPVNAYLNRLRYGAKNDQAGYLSTVESGGLTLFGEAGCHPTNEQEFPGENGRAYYALNQGRTDRLVSEENFVLSNGYPLAREYRKIDSHNTPFCSESPWAVADNGALFSGCPGSAGRFSKLLDPGYPTFRQYEFTEWARRRIEPAANTLSRGEILQFATSTASQQKQLLIELFYLSFTRYGEGAFPENKRLLASVFLDDLLARDGKVLNDAAQIILFASTSRFLSDLRQGRIPEFLHLTVPLLLPLASKVELAPLIDEERGAVLNGYLLEAIDLYYERCLPAGITTWSQMTEVVENGVVVASRFVGPGEEARMSGLFELVHKHGVLECRARLRSTSPFSFVAFDSEVYYRTFGAPLSPHTLETGLHPVAAERSWEKVQKISGTGVGYSALDSYHRFSLTGLPSDPPSAPVFATYEFSVARTTAREVQDELLRLKKMVFRFFVSKGTGVSRKALERQIKRVNIRLQEYSESTFRIEEIGVLAVNVKRALKTSRALVKRLAPSRAALQKLKRHFKKAVQGLRGG